LVNFIFNIGSLPKIHAAHEQEARYLIETIQSVRTEFTNKMTEVFKDICDFSVYTITETDKRLKVCRTLSAIEKLKNEFNTLVDRIHKNSLDQIENATLLFNDRAKMIYKSRVQGHHYSAWVLIKEYGVYDPSTINLEMDSWRQSITEEVSRVEKGVNLQIRSTLKDFEYQKQDCELVLSNKQQLQKLKILLKGETILLEKSFQNLKESVKALYTMFKETNSLREIIDIFSYLAELHLAIFKLSAYLDHSHYKRGYVRFFTLSGTDWKIWNSEECNPDSYKNENNGQKKDTHTRGSRNSLFNSRAVENSLVFLSDQWISSAKSICINNYEAYYAGSREREVKMINDIPGTHYAYAKMIDETLHKFQDQILAFKKSEIKSA
jgi:hypothetical protein